MQTDFTKMIVISIMLSGCASSTIPMAFKPVFFDDSEIAQIESAAQEWSEKSGGKHFVIIDPNCPADVCSIIEKVDIIREVFGSERLHSTGSCSGTRDDGLGISHTVTCEDGDISKYLIEIQDLSSDGQAGRRSYEWLPSLRLTALHEFGHVFLKHHDPEANNVMFANNFTEHLTERDLQNGETIFFQ